MSKKRKAPDSDNVNNTFCEFLTELADFEKNVNRNIYKYNAYRNAASVLAKHPVRIKSGDEARKLNGIGDKIAKKIDEFIKTGKLEKLEKIRASDSNKGITELMRVTGIGPAKAKELVDKEILTIDDLKKNEDKLNHHQLVGLKHLEDFEKLIPRGEIGKIEIMVNKVLKKIDSDFVLTACGSYRRGELSSGDIDGLLTHPKFTSEDKGKTTLLKRAVDGMTEAGLITDTLSLGNTKFMGVCQGDPKLPFRRLDLRLIPLDQYYCGVLYFTGSDLFNKRMRAHALQNGYTLNEYSLRPVGSTGEPGEPVEITCERDIFDYIDFKFVEPHERKN